MEFPEQNHVAVAYYSLLKSSSELKELSDDLQACKVLAQHHFNDASIDAAMLIYDRLQDAKRKKNNYIHK